MNERVVHFVYLQGPKEEMVTVKVGGREETRSRYVPQLTPAAIDEIGKDMMTGLRAETAPREWRCPRVEIWSADRQLLFEHGPGSRFIPAALLTKAVADAQARLGPAMTLAAFREASAQLAELDRALEAGDRKASARALERLDRTRGLTPALAAELARRRARLAAPEAGPGEDAPP
ncbi:MAG: hypothetical protein JXQ29_00940 [Planctomycetes bacterium]|nr:hypothetical protein [Planctomycetota bacterium]